MMRDVEFDDAVVGPDFGRDREIDPGEIICFDRQTAPATLNPLRPERSLPLALAPSVATPTPPQCQGVVSHPCSAA
jgi:hypothetical protein